MSESSYLKLFTNQKDGKKRKADSADGVPAKKPKVSYQYTKLKKVPRSEDQVKPKYQITDLHVPEDCKQPKLSIDEEEGSDDESEDEQEGSEEESEDEQEGSEEDSDENEGQSTLNGSSMDYDMEERSLSRYAYDADSPGKFLSL